MTNEQSQRLELLARLDELNMMKTCTTDTKTLEYFAKREKALREALHRTLNA